MTDKEIIKGLECCKDYGDDGMSCKDCPYAECDSKRGCASEMCEDALDLINRQKAEIERLKGWDRWSVSESHAPIIKKARSEAMNEFAGKAKEKMRDLARVDFQGDTYCLINESFFDHLVKEMRQEG